MKKAYLAPDVILKMIINDEGYLDKFLNQNKIEIVTSAFCFWEVMSCLTEEEIAKYNDKIFKIFKTIPIGDLIDSTGKISVEYEERIKHLRKVALSKK